MSAQGTRTVANRGHLSFAFSGQLSFHLTPEGCGDGPPPGQRGPVPPPLPRPGRPHGFTPRAGRPARAQTKGKAERNVGDIKQHFFVRYRAFESWTHLTPLISCSRCGALRCSPMASSDTATLTTGQASARRVLAGEDRPQRLPSPARGETRERGSSPMKRLGRKLFHRLTAIALTLVTLSGCASAM
jgi:hypothetical protein